MADKYVTTKDGTKINIGGLSPDQVAKIQSMGTGAKASALAVQYQKQTNPTGGNFDTAGKSITDLQTMLTNTQNAINQRKGNAPNYVARLSQIQQAIQQAGGTLPPNPGPGSGGNTGTPISPEAPVPGTDPGLGINAKTGGINDPGNAIGAVTGAAGEDTSKNFQMNNPGSQTDAFGNTQNIGYDPTTGQASITKTAGAGLSAANNAFVGAASDLSANGQSARMNAQNSAYNYITQNYGQQKKQEMDQATQTLTQRGIPYNPDPSSLWGRTMAQIDQKYQTLDDQAKNQSISSGNSIYSTDVGAVNSLGNTVANQAPQFTAYQGGVSNQGATLQTLLSSISSDDLQKYNIDQDTMTKLKAIAASKSGRGGSGGGGGGGDTSPIIGGTAP